MIFYSILIVLHFLQMIQTQPLFDGGPSPKVDITVVMKLKEGVDELRREMLQLKSNFDKCIPDCGKCQNGWEAFGNSCYFFANVKVNWTDAQNLCVNMSGGYLAEIESVEENYFLINESELHFPVGGNSNGYWIGGSDVKVEGDFIWMKSKHEFNFTYWSPNHLDNYKNNEDCVHLFRKEKFQWNDRPCSDEVYYICEKPMSEVEVIG